MLNFLYFKLILIIVCCTSLKTTAQICVQKGQDIKGEEVGDFLGSNVSLSSNGIVVAISINSSDRNGRESGHVEIYNFNTNKMIWEQKGQDINGERAGDFFGSGISLSSDGKVVAIGAYGNSEGKVKVYSFNIDKMIWEQIGQDINGEAVGDRSGRDVSLSSDGTTVAIGATFNDGNGSGSGHVRVYSFNANKMLWEQKGQDIDGEAIEDLSGGSLSLSSNGMVVAIGALRNDGSATNAGHVRVYSFNTNKMIWEQQGQDIDGDAAEDFFGESVSLSYNGATIAIGAAGNDGNGANAGHVQVYSFNLDKMIWEQIGQDIDGKEVDDFSGGNVALSSDGTIVAIGASFNDGNGINAGHVRVYGFNTDRVIWEQIGEDTNGDTENDRLGSSVSLSSDGRVVATGAPLSNGIRGYVRIFSCQHQKPIQLVIPTLSQWGALIFGLLILNVGLILIRTFKLKKATGRCENI